jgi:hypothetical protein
MKVFSERKASQLRIYHYYTTAPSNSLLGFLPLTESLTRYVDPNSCSLPGCR